MDISFLDVKNFLWSKKKKYSMMLFRLFELISSKTNATITVLKYELECSMDKTLTKFMAALAFFINE